MTENGENPKKKGDIWTIIQSDQPISRYVKKLNGQINHLWERLEQFEDVRIPDGLKFDETDQMIERMILGNSRRPTPHPAHAADNDPPQRVSKPGPEPTRPTDCGDPPDGDGLMSYRPTGPIGSPTPYECIQPEPPTLDQLIEDGALTPLALSTLPTISPCPHCLQPPTPAITHPSGGTYIDFRCPDTFTEPNPVMVRKLFPIHAQSPIDGIKWAVDEWNTVVDSYDPGPAGGGDTTPNPKHPAPRAVNRCPKCLKLPVILNTEGPTKWGCKVKCDTSIDPQDPHPIVTAFAQSDDEDPNDTLNRALQMWNEHTDPDGQTITVDRQRLIQALQAAFGTGARANPKESAKESMRFIQGH